MKSRWLLCAFTGIVASSVAASAADWPQWRGPHRNGISEETGLLQEWPKDGPKLLWQAKNLGGGYSTPSIVGDRAYLLSNEGEEAEFVRALNVRDGKPIWSTKIGGVGPNPRSTNYPGGRSTPTVEGDVLYVLGSDGALACLDTAGKIRWHKNLRDEFDGKPGRWAYSESPLIDGDKLICTPGGSEATMVALDKKTGNVIWKFASPQGDEAAYASPIVVNGHGVKQYVQFLGKGLVGVDAETGQQLWRYEKTAENSPANIPTPLAYDDYVYNASGRGGGALLKLVRSNGGIGVEEVATSRELPTAIGGAVELKGLLFGTTGQGMVCADAKTGQVKWQDRGIGGAGSLCSADGRLYVHAEGSGDVVLVEPTADRYQEHGRATPPGLPSDRVGKAWAYPAIANGRLYIHDYGNLWCYDIRATSTAAR